MEALVTGDQVDQFRIVRKLGQGGMSDVYLARDTTLGRKVALKIIRDELTETPNRLKLFLREAHLTAKFAHPHIITIYFVGQFKGHPYLALEYLEGQTLEERMRSRAMSALETIRLGLAIAQALEESHSHGVLHRDLKPANVVIPLDGRIRVLDFGISKVVGETTHVPASEKDSSPASKGEDSLAHQSLGSRDTDTTDQWVEEKLRATTSMLEGTPAYMAPERWRGEKVTGGADIWALGVILYEMLTKVHPYLSSERSVMDLARKIVFAQEPPPLPQNVDVPEELSQLITKMLDSKTSRRPSAKAAVHVLQGLLQRNRGQPLDKGSPFRGLLSFSERHADLFFGRSAEIEMAVERLRHEPILPIVGPSGAGKSSFVAAGIVPRLRELDHWLVLKIRPGTEPFEALGSVIQASWRDGEGNTLSPMSSVIPKFPTKVAELHAAETLNERKTSVALAQEFLKSPAKLLLELQALAEKTQGKVLLYVDQLEELYTHENDASLRQAYMEAICRAADDPKGPIRVIFSVREDFLGNVAESPAARETLSRIMVLRAPDRKALYEIVTKPVELAGYSYEDLGLPDEMLESLRDTPASLPILQFACSQLWNHRDAENRLLTRSAYEAMGGVEGALASKADELLAGLTEGQRNMARQLMLRLVTPEGTRRVVTEQELFDSLDSNAAFVLNRLTAERLVVSRRSEGGDRAELELVHDSLIHSWKPLVRWLEQSREEVVFLDEVCRAAELWDSRGRPSEEVWSGGALEETKTKLKRCEAVPNRVKEFLEAGELRRQARARGRRKIRFAIVSSLLAVIAVLAFMNRQTEHQRELAELQRDREQQARASSLREGARAAYIKGDFLEARSKLRSSLETRDSTQARALWWLLENEPLVWSMTLDSLGTDVSVSPHGRLIAASSTSINIVDTKTLRQHIFSGQKRSMYGLDFSPNGGYLSSGSFDQDIRLWDLRSGTFTVLKGHTSTVSSTVFSPDGKRLASGSFDKTIIIWDIKSTTSIRTLKNESKVTSLHFSPDGRFIISADQGGKVRLWNAQSYKLEQVLEETGIQIWDVAVSADGKLLAYCGSNGALLVRDLKSRQNNKHLSGNTDFIHSVSFSSNSDFLAASTNDGRILVWDTKNWSLHREFHHAKSPVHGVSFLPEGKQIVSTGHDGTLKLWQMDAYSYQRERAGHNSSIYALAFTPDGKTIATGSGVDGELHFWDIASSQSIRHIRSHDAPLLDIAFNLNGKLLAAGADDGSIRLYTFPEAYLRKTLYGHRAAVTSVLFSSDLKQLLSSSTGKTIAFWDLESLTLQKTLATGEEVRSMDIDPQGNLLASASPQSVQVRDIETGQVRKTFSGHTDLIFSIAFSPNGKSLYSASWDHTARRYTLGSTSVAGEVVARHQGNIYWIDVNHTTGDILGTASADGTAKIWHIDTGEYLTLKGHRDEVNRLRFSPDGTQVATVSDDSTLRLWDTKTGRPLWRAPLMLAEPPELLTEKGQILFEDNGPPSPPTTQWQKATDVRAKLASTTKDRETLCLITVSDELEIWNIPNDELTFKTNQPGIEQLLSIPSGCLTRSPDSVTLTRSTGEKVTLAKQSEAMTRSEGSIFVLQGETIRILDLEGNQQDEFRATEGATALTLVGNTLALGFPTGRLEIWLRNGSSSQKDFTCQEPESTPTTTIIPGPPGTIIAGFENGAVGIWSTEAGERLFSHQLHGPVIHLLLRDQKLYAATELGSNVQFDLHMFYIDYCALMDRVWREVFWIWEGGRARYREVPSDHECRAHR